MSKANSARYGPVQLMTNRKSYPQDPMVPPWVILISVLGPQFGKTVYISEVNGARKVNSGAPVAVNKNSDPLRNFFLKGGWGDSAPFFQTSRIVRNESS